MMRSTTRTITTMSVPVTLVLIAAGIMGFLLLVPNDESPKADDADKDDEGKDHAKISKDQRGRFAPGNRKRFRL